MTTIKLAVLDMAGTTVADDGLVLRAFAAAAAAAGLASPARGRRRPAVRPRHDGPVQDRGVPRPVGDEDRAQAANRAFEAEYDHLVDEGGATAIAGAAESISALRNAGIQVALTTGFSRTTQDKLLAALGWRRSPT